MSSFAVPLRGSRLRRRSLMLLLAATLMAGLLPVLSDARPSGAATPPAGQGVWLVAQDGGIFSHGEARFFGSTGSLKLNQPVVGMAGTPSMKGYWMVASDGGIFAFGDAGFFGSTGAMRLNKPIVGMASTPSGKGYWLVASDGGIFAFGDAAFYGSTGAVKLNKPIVGMASTPSGKGYWMVASDGGIFAFGDARFYGSTGAITLAQPIVGMAPTATSKGYWLVASDGGLFSFGDARFFGSSAGTRRTVVGMVPTPTGLGYYQATDAGEVIGFGDAYLSVPAARLNQKMIGLAAAHKPDGADPTGTTIGTSPTTPTGPGATTTTLPGGGALLTPAQKVAQSGKPNVMVIVMDDMRYEGIWDNPAVLPKTKQWMAAGGTEFVEGYVTTPLCCPERATIWSGRVPHNHKIVDNYHGDTLDRSWVIPTYLKGAGYHTALVGKFITDWNYATTAKGRYDLDPMFDDYSAFQGGYVDVSFMTKNPGDAKFHFERTSDPADSASDDTTDFIGDKVNQFVNAYEANDAQPWYVHVTPHAPHDDTLEPYFKWPARYNDVPVPPYQPTPGATVEGLESGVAEKADKNKAIRGKTISRDWIEMYHDGMLKTLLVADDTIDKIMKNLQAKGELDNTVVIFTSDNGYSWGERGVDSKGWPYTEDVKVAFAVRWPGVVPAGAVDTRPVAGEDILPTLLDAAQYTPPQFGYPLDGRSFLPGRPGKDIKLLEFGPAGPDPVDPPYKPHRDIATWASLRTTTYQYLEWYGDDNLTVQPDRGREYYDLTVDPWELNNLLEDGNPANDPDVAALSSRLQGLRFCAGTTGATACP